MIVKKFVPCIYLYCGKAVRNCGDMTVVETDPLSLVRMYNENGADELLVIDLSEGDDGHESALEKIREICTLAEMDVTGAGNIKRMEDVKKLLYAGCRRVVLDYSKQSNIDATEEISMKFGREKILAFCADPSVIAENAELTEKYISELVLTDPRFIRKMREFTDLPFYVEIEDIALNSLLDIFSCENVCGVTGNVVNNNCAEIYSLKTLCKENGIAVETFEPKFAWKDFKKNSDGMVRRSLWVKGETSGHYQYVKSLHGDCDMDTILAKVSQVGAACHTGARSCFFNQVVKKDYNEAENPLQVFQNVYDKIRDRKIHPREGSYTNYLFEKGIDKILKKLGEEATEIVIAAKNPGGVEVKYEISDFLYHIMVLMAEKDISWEEITTELANR